MKIKGIDFGKVIMASGGNNFSKEGWPYDRIFRFIPGYILEGVTHYTKTFTLEERNDAKNGLGNMDIDEETLWPKELIPSCIRVDFLKGYVFNAVGLSNLGLKIHLQRGGLQSLLNNFFLSLMSTGNTAKERLRRSSAMIALLQEYKQSFRKKFAIVRNITCPNTGHTTNELGQISETKEHLRIDARLGVPNGIKINLQTSVNTVKRLIEDGNCDFIDIPNAYPLIDMAVTKNCRQAQYILKRYNNQGGYSGSIQTPHVRDWIDNVRRQGIMIPIIAGSVYSKKHIRWMFGAGADAIALGAVKLVRPWRMKGMIKHSQRWF